MAARVGWRGFTGLAVIADAPISRCNSSLFGDSDKVVYEFYQRAEPMARFQFSGIVRAVPGTILFNQPNWRTGVASGGSVRQALKDRYNSPNWGRRPLRKLNQRRTEDEISR
jgi:hypothetical protein